jgi:hypothetical protein
LERRKAEKALEDICHSKLDAARASTKDSMPHTGPLATASAPEAAEGPDNEEEDGDGAVPEWLEHSDGRFSPPLLPADAVAGDILDEEDDRELLLAARTQVALRSCVAFSFFQFLVYPGSPWRNLVVFTGKYHSLLL